MGVDNYRCNIFRYVYRWFLVILLLISQSAADSGTFGGGEDE